jgi:cytochrome c
MTRPNLAQQRRVQNGIVLLAGALMSMAGACSSPGASPAPARSTQALVQEAPERFGFGRSATPEEIAALDIDVRPDGTGLPEGSGSVAEGRAIYAAKCAACHGASGVEGPNDRLVGRLPGDAFSFGDDLAVRPLKAVGSYWPYSTTLFDYIRRAMPQSSPGSLENKEVYALTAFLLHRNELIDENAVMDRVSLPAVVMPARDHFVPDDRLEHDEVH